VSFLSNLWERIGKGSLIALFEVLSNYLAEVTEKKLQKYLVIVGVSPEFRSGNLLNTNKIFTSSVNAFGLATLNPFFVMEISLLRN
jgi:hypothetical protein